MSHKAALWLGCLALPLTATAAFVLFLAWRTERRLDRRMIGSMCIVARDADLARRPGKERAVRAMLARGVLDGEGGAAPSLNWALRLAATDYLGLAFTTRAQRARWYDTMPRCRGR